LWGSDCCPIFLPAVSVRFFNPRHLDCLEDLLAGTTWIVIESLKVANPTMQVGKAYQTWINVKAA
jgi:hypothetical protein